MNCYRCGYDYSGQECLVCGKQSPTEDNPVGGDSQTLRIAVLIHDSESIETFLQDYKEKAFHYQFCDDSEDKTHIFVYTPDTSVALFELLEKTEEMKERTILFNGRKRPYDTDLWLPLLWFSAL